ncbi:MAG: FlgO family outer membrane protein [Elusimicrobiales bacterium]
MRLFFIFLLFLFNTPLKADDLYSYKQIAKELSKEIKSVEEKENRKIKVAVLDFTYYDNKTSPQLKDISESLSVNLAKNKVLIAERNQIETILKEKKVQSLGIFDIKAITELGTFLGADAVLTGTVYDLPENKSKLNIKVIDAKTSLYIASGEYIIKRNWEYYKVQDKLKLDGDKKSETIYNEIKIELEKLPEVKIPQFNLPDITIDLQSFDVEKFKKYDLVYKYEKTTDDYLKIAKKWEELSKEVPEFKDIAKERAEMFRKYYEEILKYEKARKELEKKMKKDGEKLKEILALEVITPKQKDELASKFIDAYGKDNEYSKGFEQYLISPCCNKGKMGYCYYDGSIALDAEYDYAGSFSEGLADVKLNGKYGFIDKSGREVIPFKYDDAYSFSEGLAKVKLNGKYGFIDKSGKEVIPFKYDWANSFSEGLAAVKYNDKWGFIDKSGKEVIPFKYNSIACFIKGFLGVSINGKWGFIDKSGKEVIPFKYDDIAEECYINDFFWVNLNGKWGYVDKWGRECCFEK